MRVLPNPDHGEAAGPASGHAVDPAIEARRAEVTGEALRERATANLEAQLVRARAELDAAREQRAGLAARLKQAERDLRAARQTEFAETARREELEADAAGADRRAQEETAHLRTALAAREQRVAELEEELTRLLSTGLHDRLHENEQNVARLERALTAERAVRQQALADLAAERDRSAAEVMLLQSELEHRGHVHDAISRQLVDLRHELDSARGQLAVDAGRKAVAEAVLADLGATAAQLRAQLQELERDGAVLRQQLAAAQAAVVQREQQAAAAEAALAAAEAGQAQLRQELDAAAVALRAASSDAAETHVRLQGVEQALGAAEARSRELARRLETERLQWIQNEAGLQRAIAQEREGFQATLAHTRAELEQALAQERARFTTEMEGVRTGIHALRERLTGSQEALSAQLAAERQARTQIEQQVLVEHAARVAAEEQLLEAQAAAAVADERVESERRARAGFESRLAERDAQIADVMAAVTALRGELERARAQYSVQEEREAQLEALVGELVTTTEALNSEFEHELAALETAQERQLSGQRTQFEAQLATLEGRVVDLREQMATATADMVRKLEAERTARRRAESELQKERELTAAAAAEREPAEGDGPDDDVAALRTELQRREREAELAEERIVELEDELEEARVALRPQADLPPADHPALTPATSGTGSSAESVEALADEADSVIIDLARAAARLRTRRGEEPAVPPPAATDEPATPAEATSVAEADENGSHGDDTQQAASSAEPEGPAADARGTGSADADEALPGAAAGDPADPDDAGAPVAAGGPEEEHHPGVPPARLVAAALRAKRRSEGLPDEPELPTIAALTGTADAAGDDVEEHVAIEDVEDFELGPRIGRQYVTAAPWLATALARLARRDPRVAATVIEQLLPVQAARLQHDLTYDLAIAGHPELRVELFADGTANVARRSAEDAAESASFRIVGSPVAVAAYVAGNAPRRGVPGVVVTGRRRRAKKLTHIMREPVGMAELTLLATRLPSITLMTLLAAAIDPEETRGDHFTIGFAEGDAEPGVFVVVAGGLPIAVRATAPQHVAATVRVNPRGLASFLGGQGSARVSGDLAAVGRLLAWADTAQGLDG